VRRRRRSRSRSSRGRRWWRWWRRKGCICYQKHTRRLVEAPVARPHVASIHPTYHLEGVEAEEEEERSVICDWKHARKTEEN
jgi:hypothetical protein